tara:strand:+ start:288 stop:848 length:561 start_codon:yes stop_codon:yes gene_type:complete
MKISSNDGREEWSEFLHHIEIKQARVVAMLGRDGGAIVENVRRLFCREGRVYNAEDTKVGYVHSLDYQFAFTSCALGAPTLASAAHARLVISGHHSNGHWIEVRGNGVIGYDKEGCVEGILDAMPSIMTEAPISPIDENQASDEAERQRAEDLNVPPQFALARKSIRAVAARRQAAKAMQARVKRR